MKLIGFHLLVAPPIRRNVGDIYNLNSNATAAQTTDTYIQVKHTHNGVERMTNQADYFDKNRFIYLSGVLSKEVCDRLTQHMFDLFKEGKLTKDPQCPLSDSIYGDPAFDKILGDLAGPLSSQLGVELLPCYTYARIYRPGEVLKRHTDREACEISGTLTLGFDPGSELWPIFFAKDPTDEAGTPLNIDVGDLVMYRGNELTHWRPAYRGLWQVQVFFHFVDANGPHKEHAFDKRPGLGMKPETKGMVCDRNMKVGSVYEELKDDGRKVFRVDVGNLSNEEAATFVRNI